MAPIIMSQTVSPSTPVENVPLGAALIVAAFLLVAIMSALGKGAAVSTSAIVFFQNFISLLLFLPWVLHHGFGELKTKHLVLHGVRGLGGVLSQVLMFIAILKMPLMNTVLLELLKIARRTMEPPPTNHRTAERHEGLVDVVAFVKARP
jgi:hypothetical protein